MIRPRSYIVIIIREYRKAETPPLSDWQRADRDCDWDSADPTFDDEGYLIADYTPQGSYPLTFWESQTLAVLLS